MSTSQEPCDSKLVLAFNAITPWRRVVDDHKMCTWDTVEPGIVSSNLICCKGKEAAMFDDLRGKTAVVTGSSKGLGAAIARRLGAEGMNVVTNYHTDEEGARKTVRAIEDAGGAAAAVQADVSKPECVEALYDAALFSFGGIDVWVNNAGIETSAPSHAKSVEEWQKVIDVNLTGVFVGCQYALNHFLDNGLKGTIINLSSVHEIIPWPGFADYAASKAGIGMLTKTLALEYADRGIRVNAIAPGAMNTPINAKKFADPKQRESTERLIPMGFVGEPEDVAAAAAWLASEQAKYVTGTTLFVDGGMTLYPGFQHGDG